MTALPNDIQLVIEDRPDYLYAAVSGPRDSQEISQAYWTRVAAECQRRKARKLLDSTGDVEFRRRVLKALGQAALEEGAEWLLIHRERPPDHGKL